ncbi:MAG: MIP family channel protein [Planctomycetes bacterium]|nr:MIP family channel protein [Planctomycetota bacterium]MBI3846865.1 MIP family channel protein [Planctomycetota bacterium]
MLRTRRVLLEEVTEAPPASSTSLVGPCLGEFLGTFILVFFGVGSVHTAVATGAQVGLWQVAIVWGTGITLAIYSTAALSGAHINPAITIAMAAWNRFPARRVTPYLVSQLVGAVAAAAVLYALFNPFIVAFEAKSGIVRGAAGSEASAMMYGEYFPNPGMIGTTPEAYAKVPIVAAFAAELLGTFLLALFVFALTDRRNAERPRAAMAPLFIGLAVAAIISIVAPLTQAGLNPARDFGPRLVAYAAGWGRIAIPGPRGGFFVVYVVAPVIGALVGGLLYTKGIRPLQVTGTESGKEPSIS